MGLGDGIETYGSSSDSDGDGDSSDDDPDPPFCRCEFCVQPCPRLGALESEMAERHRAGVQRARRAWHAANRRCDAATVETADFWCSVDADVRADIGEPRRLARIYALRARVHKLAVGALPEWSYDTRASLIVEEGIVALAAGLVCSTPSLTFVRTRVAGFEHVPCATPPNIDPALVEVMNRAYPGLFDAGRCDPVPYSQTRLQATWRERRLGKTTALQAFLAGLVVALEELRAGVPPAEFVPPWVRVYVGSGGSRGAQAYCTDVETRLLDVAPRQLKWTTSAQSGRGARLESRACWIEFVRPDLRDARGRPDYDRVADIVLVDALVSTSDFYSTLCDQSGHMPPTLALVCGAWRPPSDLGVVLGVPCRFVDARYGELRDPGADSGDAAAWSLWDDAAAG